MTIWSEFKQTLLPWVIAALVIGVLLFESHRNSQTILDISARQTEAMREQAKTLDGIRTLMSQQGYVVPPSLGTR